MLNQCMDLKTEEYEYVTVKKVFDSVTVHNSLYAEHYFRLVRLRTGVFTINHLTATTCAADWLFHFRRSSKQLPCFQS